jgi:glutamate synthase (NADPH/NADH) small chain
MPEQEPRARAKNFGEVALGYSPKQAMAEAGRCLGCKTRPCVGGCPVNVDIPAFLAAAAAGDFAGAYGVIRQTNALPAVCGRVCPQESQCEQLCVRGKKGEAVGIGRVERFAADWALEAKCSEKSAPSQGQPSNPRPAEPPQKRAGEALRVAVIGAGPAGLSCAGELARRGYQVTIFEALHKPGGVLVYGIPEFRLPKRIVAAEIEGLRRQGVAFELNAVIGKTITVEELLGEFSAVFIGSGAGLPNFMNIPGENYNGVYSANEYLTRANLMRAFDPAYDTPTIQSKKVAVVGGGNVAMDAARCALRLGAREVSIVYRRTEAEMPARREEIHHAAEEGVRFVLLTAPVRVLGDENRHVCGLECVQMQLGEPGADGRRRVSELPGTNFVMELDTVIVAIGNKPNTLVEEGTAGLETNRHNCLLVRENSLQTMRDGVFAGGDIVTGAATVILAMGAGRQAAAEIDDYLQK